MADEVFLSGDPAREALPQPGGALGFGGEEIDLLAGIGGEVEEGRAVAGDLEDILPVVLADPELILVHAGDEEGAVLREGEKEKGKRK